MTTLKCGDWKCSSRKNVNQFAADRTEPKPTLRNIVCNVHAGALKRSRYRNDPLPIPPSDRERLLAEQAEVDRVARAEADAKHKEREARYAERFAEEWATLDTPAGHALEKDAERFYHSEKPEPVFEGMVWEGERPENPRWDSRWFQLQPSQRNYGGEGPQHPYIIHLTRGANLTPNMARELAAVLIEAADKADEFNAERRPKG